ncbi:MAG: hypothetical protein MI923_21585 [Phycisphaerales bacterium]|nr:hypothetical protein [Phycisphaerales bacterium]
MQTCGQAPGAWRKESTSGLRGALSLFAQAIRSDRARAKTGVMSSEYAIRDGGARLNTTLK